MLIPGLPPAGTQQEVFKPDRQPRTTPAEGLAHDPLAELPVEEQSAFQQQGQHAGDGRNDNAEQQGDAPAEPDTASPGTGELPRKGLMVDIRA